MIKLSPKEELLYKFLAQNAGKVCRFEDIFEAVWKNRSIGHESLTRCVSGLRKKLSSRNVQIISHSKRGYSVDHGVGNIDYLRKFSSSSCELVIQSAETLIGFRGRDNVEAALFVLYNWIDNGGFDAAVFTKIAQFEILCINRGYNHPELGRQRALAAVQKALKLEPSNGSALAILGWLEVVISHEREGISRFSGLRGLSPLHRYYLAHAQAAAGRLDDALENFLECAAQQPSEALYSCDAAIILSYCGDHGAALDLIRRCIVSSPWDGYSHFAASIVKSSIDDWNGAIASVSEARRLNSDADKRYLSYERFFRVMRGERVQDHDLNVYLGQDDMLKYISSDCVPFLFATLGADRAIAMAKGAFQIGCPHVWISRYNPRFRDLYNFLDEDHE